MQQERPGAPLPFEACENFRELPSGYTGCGGRHVKYGAFYRSPALANIKTPADRARFEALGVRTVFDFRSEKERTLAPDPDFPGVVDASGQRHAGLRTAARWISTWKSCFAVKTASGC